MQRIKETGPQGVVRPFQPTIEVQSHMTPEARQTEALEHIAVSISAIDHNLELLTKAMFSVAEALKQR
jgi:hypothetical protein